MTTLQDRILSVFIDQQARVLKDSDVRNGLINQGIPCSIEDVRRQVQSLSPALFQMVFNEDRTVVTIRVEPTLELCEEFLSTRCQAPAKTCEKLHICRRFGNCSKEDCHFPHDFTRGCNRAIVAKHHCQHIDSVLLVKLLRLRESASRTPHTRGGRVSNRRRGGPGRHGNRGGGPGRYGNRGGGPGRYGNRGGGLGYSAISTASLVDNGDTDRQVDVSFPSSRLAKQIDMEEIGLLLTVRNMKIENKLNENENEYCRRGTIEFERISDVDKLLFTPILIHKGIDIKFKRTKQLIDKTSFILKTPITNEKDKIDSSRFELYVTTLVDKSLIDTISDFSSDSEQIMLVQCTSEIDFDKVRQKNRSKPQLFGKNITFTQIYECDAVEIHYQHDNQPITENDLKMVFNSVWTEIFAYNFPSNDRAEVEFINANAFKQWMSKIELIKKKFHVIINPIIDSVDDDIQSNVSNEPDQKPRQTTISLRPDWTIIASHKKFKLEYKEFIHHEFGGEVDIQDDKVIYTGTFPNHFRGSRDDVILGNKTHEFMRKFECKTFSKLTSAHVDILHANSATVAFSRTNGNDYIVATKLHEMSELERKLFPITKQYSLPQQQLKPVINSPTTNKYPSLPVTTSVAFTSMYSIMAPEHLSMFSIDKFEDHLRQYLQDTFNVKVICERYNHNNEKTKGIRTSIRIKLSGQQNDVENVTDDLENLFSAVCTKKFDDKTDGTWTKIDEATQVIQYHFQLADMICACQRLSPANVVVYYFDITNPQFGTDEQKIEDVIKDRFRSATIPCDQKSISTKFTRDWTDLEEKIRQRDDYKKNLCFQKESNTIYLFGLPDLVKEYRQKFEQLKHKYDLQPCQLTLSERQLNYLTYVAKSDVNNMEKQYKSQGCDVSLARLRRNCEFLAPPDMHSEIKDKFEALAQIQDTTFTVDEPGFEILISKEPERLNSLVKSKCFLEKTIETCRVHIPIPKARVADLEDGIKQPTGATASALPNATSFTINHSTLTILTGDLATQKVDAIVACSSSQYLCQEILGQAGPEVQKEYKKLKLADQFPGTTPGGTLPCKEIIFIPWAPESRDTASVKASLSSFIATAFMQAFSAGYKSIAFPAVGCGKFNYDPLIIAKYMLNETRKQLKACKTKMNIFFVLLAKEQIVYDAFVKRLNEMENIDLTVSHKIPTKKPDDESSVPYDRKTIKITLISSNEHHLMKSREDIYNLARSFSTKSQITKQDMLDWPQKTISNYYDYCLKQRVIPTLDLENTTLELIGAKEAVDEAKNYFYELTSKIYKDKHIQAVSQGVIWSVELTPNSDIWEQYSFKLNGIIEDASKKHPYIEFENDKEETCRLTFSTMEERCAGKIRSVRRKLVDSILPKTWEPSDQNCKRVVLPSSSPEYQEVLNQFRVTMKDKYSQIIKIERIQNVRWYKQYAAHRDDFQRRYSQTNERLLFHGCSSASADQIIEGCYNRAFAGANGILYGKGVYFHAQASYSHQYAPANSSGERKIFLASVLIGKSCKGDPTMVTPPAGHDTTTDGQHIFVVYHDAGAYADHLITYK